MPRTRTRRYGVLALQLLAGGLVVGLIVWRATSRTTTGTAGGSTVYTHAENPAECIAQARAFSDYPLVFAGPGVLGYPLVHCSHMMTRTRYGPDGRVSHPGGDSWTFVYGSCTVPEGRESCPPPVSIVIDPCARVYDGRIIPRGSRPLRSMTLRGAQADIGDHGISFEQTPQIIWIYASGSSPDTEQQVANAIAVAEALVPANGLANAIAHGAPLTAAFAAAQPHACAMTEPLLAATATSTSTPTPIPDIHIAGGPAVSAPGGSSGNTFTIEVTGVTDLRGYSVAAEYDESVITVTAVTDISALPSIICASNVTTDGGGLHSDDPARYAFESTCASKATTGLPGGTRALVRVTFTCLGSGTSTPISFDSAPGFTVASVNSAAVDPATHVNGVVTCT